MATAGAEYGAAGRAVGLAQYLPFLRCGLQPKCAYGNCVVSCACPGSLFVESIVVQWLISFWLRVGRMSWKVHVRDKQRSKPVGALGDRSRCRGCSGRLREVATVRGGMEPRSCTVCGLAGA